MSTEERIGIEVLRALEETAIREGRICFLLVESEEGVFRPARILTSEKDFRAQVEEGLFNGKDIAVRFLDVSLEEHVRDTPTITLDQIRITGTRTNIECGLEKPISDELVNALAEIIAEIPPASVLTPASDDTTP